MQKPSVTEAWADGSRYPFAPVEKSRSPTTMGELVARLWGKTLSSPIMSIFQTMSPPMALVSVSAV